MAAELPPNLGDMIQLQIKSVLEKCRGAVVHIVAVDEHGPLSGTGFFVASDGLLYTSYTVGGDSHDIVVIQGDSKYLATRVAADARSGVAILKVDAPSAFLPLSTQKTAVGSPVISVGFPMDLPLTPSFGIVGGFDRKYLGSYFATTHIRANVPVQRGQGGAPLLNLNGEVVGITISSLDQGSALFALPIEAAEKVRRDCLRFGRARPGWIGIDVALAAQPAAGSTAVVHNVFPNTPSDRVGIRMGDILVQVGATKITEPEDVIDASFFISAEDGVEVKVMRGERMLDFEVSPEDPPMISTGVPQLGSLENLRGGVTPGEAMGFGS